MTTIKITSKRQATFPIELCEDLGLEPGDDLILEQKIINGQLMWILRPLDERLAWLGALKKYAHNKSHQLEDIRRNIARAGKK